MEVERRHNVRISGQPGGQPMLFAHGFGCDQHMWRHVAPHFERTHRVVLFDLMGAGGSDLAAYDPARYSGLDGYADDLLEICDELGLTDVVLVAHSVSAMTAVLAAARRPGCFAHLVLVSPSPRYIDDGDYRGGFNESDIAELLDSLDSNYLGWSAAMAPVIAGPASPEVAAELTDSFCRADPEIARRFARVTFLSDSRPDLGRVTTPTLVLQCRHDAIAPVGVGEYVAAAIPGSRYVLLDTTGHCPHLSDPAATVAAIDAYLSGAPVG
ncbi:MAG TPA: alpha/beta hydrolase [Acidimicrobiales bacterium]|nr:alpha/beta hydrolase [Acidimicrobiales bacterium]